MRKQYIKRIGLLALLVMPTLGTAEHFTVLRVSTPLIASGGVGMRLGRDVEGMQPSIQAEAGIGGGRVAVGLDSTGRSKVGLGLKAAIMRTWIEPIGVDENQNFLGLEAELSLRQLLFSAGGYRRIGDGDDDWAGSLGLGFIF